MKVTGITFCGRLVLLFGLVSCPVESRRKIINYGSGWGVDNNEPTTPNMDVMLSGKMEDILDSPKFRHRKPGISQDPDVWGDALAAYDKMLRNRGQQVDPNGDAIGFVKPGLFSPWANPLVENHAIDVMGFDYPKQKPALPPPPPRVIITTQKVDNNVDYVDVVRQRQQGTISSHPVEEMTVYERLLENKVMTRPMMYRGCGTHHPRGKVCYGVPYGCIEERLCRLIVTFSFDDTAPKHITVHLAGEAVPSGFVAVAFSDDRFAGNDVAVYCINVANMPDPKKVALYLSYTGSHKSFMQKDKFFYVANVGPNFGHHTKGVMACSFNLSTVVYLDDGSIVDILQDPFYLMLSFGHYIDTVPINHTDYGSLYYEHLMEFSEGPVILNAALRNPEIIYPESHFWRLLHVFMSVIAHVFLVPSGMIMAKYGREIFGYPKRVACFLFPMWLLVHLSTILFSVLLIGISLGAIFVDLDYHWRSIGILPGMHSLLGAVSIGLIPVNGICGICIALNRPPPGEGAGSGLKFLTWTHWAAGHLIYFLGISCVAVSGSMRRAQTPCFVPYFALLHLLIHFVVHVVMSCNTYKLVNSIDHANDNDKHLFQRAFLGPMIPWKRRDSPTWKTTSLNDFRNLPLWKARRRAIIVYIITSFLCAFTICILMLFPTVICR